MTTYALSKHSNKPLSANRISLARPHVSKQLSRRLPYYLTSEEAHKLIDAAGNERDELFLRLLWQIGVRVSEAISLRLSDVGRLGLRVLGKGQVERVVFVQQDLVSAILFYAQERALGRTDYLFPSRKGEHITKQRSDQIIKRAARVPVFRGTCMPTCSVTATPATS